MGVTCTYIIAWAYKIFGRMGKKLAVRTYEAFILRFLELSSVRNYHVWFVQHLLSKLDTFTPNCHACYVAIHAVLRVVITERTRVPFCYDREISDICGVSWSLRSLSLCGWNERKSIASTRQLELFTIVPLQRSKSCSIDVSDLVDCLLDYRHWASGIGRTSRCIPTLLPSVSQSCLFSWLSSKKMRSLKVVPFNL